MELIHGVHGGDIIEFTIKPRIKGRVPLLGSMVGVSLHLPLSPKKAWVGDRRGPW